MYRTDELSRKNNIFESWNLLSFEVFCDSMLIDQLNLSDDKMTYLKNLFNKSQSLKTKGQAFDCIDMLVTERNFETFKSSLNTQVKMNDMIADSLKKLYFKTDMFALKGNITEAKKSWQLLMVIVKKYNPSIISLPLNEFDGGIPKFPSFIIIDFSEFARLNELKKSFTKIEIKFLDALYDEARLYYEIGHYDKGDEIWHEINDILNQRKRK